jgi:hypothetical protein
MVALSEFIEANTNNIQQQSTLRARSESFSPAAKKPSSWAPRRTQRGGAAAKKKNGRKERKGRKIYRQSYKGRD